MISNGHSYNPSDNNSRMAEPGAVQTRKQRRRRTTGNVVGSTNESPIASGSTTPSYKSRDSRGHHRRARDGNRVKAVFDESEDFIPFTFDDLSEEDVTFTREPSKPATRDKKGKLKLTDDGNGLSELPVENSRSLSPVEHEREWDRGKRPEENRKKHSADDRSRRKRKLDSSIDLEDGYSTKKQRLDAKSRLAPWISGLDWGNFRNVAELLHHEVKAFTNWISPTPVEDEIRGLIVDLISRAIHFSFPDAQVLPFGSYETKLYLPLGDIDLVVVSESMAYSNKANVLHAIAKTLKRAGITSNVTIIAKAKVPIVKFVTAHGRFNVDISINQKNGLLSGEIINGFLRNLHGHGDSGRESLALRSLVLVTKAFLSQRSMNEVFSGGLGSYSIVCLAISFLQMHPKIRRGEIEAESNLGVLVMEFFELYGCYFDYNEVGISVRDGGTYYNKRQRGWADYNKQYLLSIEDPADISNDISKGSYAVNRVRTTFAGAFGILTSTAYLRASMLAARRNGRSVHLRQRYEDEDMSILTSVMGVTQETINHRKLVQEVYDKRLLHNMLGVGPRPVITNKRLPASTDKHALTSYPSPNGVRNITSDGKERHMNISDDEEYAKDMRPEIQETEEEGRYNIVREPPRKRQKRGKEVDAHAVFLPYEDDLATEEGELSDALEYASTRFTTKGDNGRQASESRGSRRRSFWLAKSTSGREVDERDVY